MRRLPGLSPCGGLLRLTGAALLAAAVLGACRGGEDPAKSERGTDDLQTVDVAPPPDARVDPSTDRQERRRAETFSGVLPGGYPESLPLPTGGSLVDQGPGWIEVLVGRAPAAVRAEYLRALGAAGWQVEGRGNDLQLRRQGRVAGVRLSADGPSTRLRIAY